MIVYQLLAHGRWFSLGTPASSTTKTGRHDIAEILLKMALKHQNEIKSNSGELFSQLRLNFANMVLWKIFGSLHLCRGPRNDFVQRYAYNTPIMNRDIFFFQKFFVTGISKEKSVVLCKL